MSATRRWRSRSTLITVGLVVALVAVVVLSFVLAPENEFPGADAQATDTVAQVDPDYEPWFSHIFSPGSGEIESGLFALQAAIGGGIIGYVFGALRTRRKYERPAADSAGLAADSTRPTADPVTDGETTRGSDPLR